MRCACTLANILDMRPVSRRLLRAALEGCQDQTSLLGEHCYSCRLDKLPPELSTCFTRLYPDEETWAFIRESTRWSGNICLQLLYSFVQLILSPFLSQTSINGLLERGRMFVFSRDHLLRLLPATSPQIILDIGSGDGHVTDKLQSLGATVHVTEISSTMQRILRKKGYKWALNKWNPYTELVTAIAFSGAHPRVLDAYTWHCEPYTYDIISCLNLLDRCDQPLSILRHIHSRLAPGGLLILAVVMPFEPFVETGPRHSHPAELLPVSSDGWEEGVSDLWTNVLRPLGFTPVSLSRLPYLCEGDLHQDYYLLDDAVMVLRKE